MRMFALCVVAVTSLAFAPAPFPRPERSSNDRKDLERIEGTWTRVLYKGQPENPMPTIRVTGTRYQYEDFPTLYVLTLDPTKRPKRLDLVQADNPSVYYRGIYRLEGDSFTYCIQDRIGEADRPTDFDSPGKGAWVAVFVRKKP